MKFTTPEISWHGRDPLYGVDFQYGHSDITRFATCGTDRCVRLWQLKQDSDGNLAINFLSSLNRHARTVNTVRFSPDGTLLASGSDDATIMIWKLNPLPPDAANLFKSDTEDQEENVENWSQVKVLRSHLEDIYDVSWSSCGKFLVSGSVDNTAILWDITKGAKIKIFSDHKSFVQGVAFDPLGQFFATMSPDRTCRVYKIDTKTCINVISKQTIGVTATEGGKPAKTTRMFHDDSLKFFFRRLCFTPDGQLLIVPTGCIENGTVDETINTSYIFTRFDFSKPVVHIPASKKPSIVVRCSPIFYELRNVNTVNTDDKAGAPVFDLPYRMIFAIATEDSVIFYDTQQLAPFALLSKLHYYTLSDLAWSSDGRYLILASSDGFCTIATFEENELGIPYKKPALIIAADVPGSITDEGNAVACHTAVPETVEPNHNCVTGVSNPSIYPSSSVTLCTSVSASSVTSKAVFTTTRAVNTKTASSEGNKIPRRIKPLLISSEPVNTPTLPDTTVHKLQTATDKDTNRIRVQGNETVSGKDSNACVDLDTQRNDASVSVKSSSLSPHNRILQVSELSLDNNTVMEEDLHLVLEPTIDACDVDLSDVTKLKITSTGRSEAAASADANPIANSENTGKDEKVNSKAPRRVTTVLLKPA